jgi:hypothetical protein
MTGGIYWNSDATSLGDVTADVHGTFAGRGALTFTVPAGAVPGANTVIALGGTWPPVTVSAAFTVE